MRVRSKDGSGRCWRRCRLQTKVLIRADNCLHISFDRVMFRDRHQASLNKNNLETLITQLVLIGMTEFVCMDQSEQSEDETVRSVLFHDEHVGVSEMILVTVDFISGI